MRKPLDVKINFIPEGPGQRKRLITALIVIAVTTLTGWLLYTGWLYGMELAEKEMETTRLAQQLEEKQTQNKTLSRFQDMESETKFLGTAAAKVDAGNYWHYKTLAEVYSLVPPVMGLTEIEITRQLVIIKGLCPDYSVLGALVASLDASPYFGAVKKITSAIRASDQQLEFSLDVVNEGVGL